MMDDRVTRVLNDLHGRARGDWRQIPRVLPHVLWRRATGKSLMRSMTPAMLKGMYIPVSRDQGRLLYAMARGAGVRRVVEFGASFGISTLYLAAAVRDNGGGRLITTEIEPSKCLAAAANVAHAGLSDVVEVREGDALETLKDVAGPIDMVFLDGWKDLYLPVIELLTPKLCPGALVVADNVNMADTKPYLSWVRGSGDFVSATLPGNSVECSWYTRGAA